MRTRWPWLIALSAAAAIAAATLPAAPAALYMLLKPLTTVLLIAYAWPRGADAPKQRRLVLIGLVLSLAGDVFLLWPRQGFLPGLVAFLLAHLAYIAAFCVPLRLGSKPLVFAAYAVMAALVLAALWPGVPPALRAPVVAYVICLGTMAAQAAAWWRASVDHHKPDAALARTDHQADTTLARIGHKVDTKLARMAALGGLLFMASDSLLATNKFALPLPLAPLWILATYWLAQWCIASALRGPQALPREPA